MPNVLVFRVGLILAALFLPVGGVVQAQQLDRQAGQGRLLAAVGEIDPTIECELDPEVGGPAGKYFVNASGAAVWLVDPGINGTHNTRPDGSTVRKFDAPKATLVSYIIKGILDQKLPWALVLLGVMISVTPELAFVPALDISFQLNLPLSAPPPIFPGRLRAVRRHGRRHGARARSRHVRHDPRMASTFTPGAIVGRQR